MRIGPYLIDPPVVLAPMAGVTDKPFRQLCKRLGAGLAVSEMTTADPRLWTTRKSLHRMDHVGEPDPISVQIAGYDPAMLADAARYNVGQGAEIIDINMGCPAKKVCNVSAGSALLENESLVSRILEAVVGAVEVPVTLKIRTGPAPERRNALRIARIAESAGVQLLAIHGRTRACAFAGRAEYETIAEVKSAVRIPVIANGDVTGPEAALAVLEATGADGIMIGRAAQGRPWLFREIAHYLATGERLAAPSMAEIGSVLAEQLVGLYDLYGPEHGARIARKHIGWTVRGLPGGESFRSRANLMVDAEAQLKAAREYFAALAANDDSAWRLAA